MKDVSQAIDIVWRDLTSAGIGNAGKIFKITRALNSRSEDIVINALPISEGTLQRCYINVNVYVNNLKLNIDGQADNTLPNTVRLKELTSAVISALEEVSADDHYYFVQQQAIIRDEQIGQHYSNIRIEFYFTN